MKLKNYNNGVISIDAVYDTYLLVNAQDLYDPSHRNGLFTFRIYPDGDLVTTIYYDKYHKDYYKYLLKAFKDKIFIENIEHMVNMSNGTKFLYWDNQDEPKDKKFNFLCMYLYHIVINNISQTKQESEQI